MSSHSHRRDEPEAQGSESSEPQDPAGLLGALFGGTTGQGGPQANMSPAASDTPPGDEVLGSLSGSIKNAPMMGQSDNPAPGAGTPPASTGDPMSDLLGSLLGGSGGAPAMGGQSGDLGSLLGSLLGGTGAQGGMPQGGMPQGGSGDPMGDLLGSLFGGGGSAPAMGGQGDPMGGLLGGLLGGMMGGGMSGTPGMGAMGEMSGLNSILAPLAEKLADKTGIPPQLAMTVMAIVIPMVINKLMSSGQQSGDLPGALGSLQGQGLTFTSHEQNEMIRQLAAQTGMDQSTAAQTITQAVQVLGS